MFGRLDKEPVQTDDGSENILHCMEEGPHSREPLLQHYEDVDGRVFVLGGVSLIRAVFDLGRAFCLPRQTRGAATANRPIINTCNFPDAMTFASKTSRMGHS